MDKPKTLEKSKCREGPIASEETQPQIVFHMKSSIAALICVLANEHDAIVHVNDASFLLPNHRAEPVS